MQESGERRSHARLWILIAIALLLIWFCIDGMWIEI
jgi:hypothetical protein